MNLLYSKAEQQSSSAGAKIGSEQGIFIVFTALALLGIMAVFFFIVDVARLQSSKLLLQRALDSSSLAATYMFEERDASGNPLSDHEITQIAQKILDDNLRHTGLRMISAPQIELIKSGSRPRFIAVNSIVSTPLLMASIPGMAKLGEISAFSKAGNRKVAAVLVLDRSESMLDLACAGCSSTKFDELKKALHSFVDQFTSGDYVSIVSFAETATVEHAMQPLGDKAAIHQIIDKLPVGGEQGTALYLGIEQATSQIEALKGSDLLPHDLKSVILVSDGAPMGPQTPAPEEVDVDGSNYDNICNDDLASPGGNPDSATRRKKRRYIRPLQQADLLRRDGAMLFAVGLGAAPLPKHGKQDVHCTENQNHPDFAYYSTVDPYQCISYDTFVKTHLLARLANDQEKLRGGYSETITIPTDPPLIQTVTIPAHPNFPSSCVAANSEIVGQEGKFYQTPNASELQRLLLATAKTIKMRLFQ